MKKLGTPLGPKKIKEGMRIYDQMQIHKNCLPQQAVLLKVPVAKIQMIDQCLS